MTSQSSTVEFSRRLDVARIGATPMTERVSASEGERRALARRFGLVALDRLESTLVLVRRPGGLIRVDGEIVADVVQTCVVSLDDFASELHDTFTLYFTERADRSEAAVDLDAQDDEASPEPVENGAIDLGETVAQQLSLALDPYPRAPGVALERSGAGDDDGDNPFRALADRLAGSKGRN